MKISATIVALNEEQNLPRTLAKLGFCDEILVVDSGSSDRTVEIARSFGARVVHQDWLGYAAQKNFAAEKASHDWILSLDADEELSDPLAESIRTLRSAQPPADVAGYRFPRRARYLGAWIRHSGWYPDAKVRLYDRRRARWVGRFVHESVAVDGTTGALRGDLLHFTCDDFSRHIRTVDRYTSLAALELAERGAPLWRLLLGPPWAFFRTFFWKMGFLDGGRGFLIAVMAAFYVFAKHAKARYPAATS